MIFGRKKKARSLVEDEDVTGPDSTEDLGGGPRRDGRRRRERCRLHQPRRRRPTRPAPARRGLRRRGPTPPATCSTPRPCMLTSRRHEGPFEVAGESAGTSDEPTDYEPRIDLEQHHIVTPVPGFLAARNRSTSEQEHRLRPTALSSRLPHRAPTAASRMSSTSSALSRRRVRALGRPGRPRPEPSANGSPRPRPRVAVPPSSAAGPFGVELRRLLPVTTPDGEQGYQPSRMWVAEGPRWLLRGIVYGQAAIEERRRGPGGRRGARRLPRRRRPARRRGHGARATCCR